MAVKLLIWLILFLLSLLTLRTHADGYSTTYSIKDFSKNVTNLLDKLLDNYDRRIRPGHGGPPTTILVNMNVRSMGPFSEKQESYQMQLYLRQEWHDPRLRFDRTSLGRTEFSMNWGFAAKLWKPDTFFINGKNSAAHKITAPNMFIRLSHNGQITWSIRLTVRASCKMHLRKFPLDTQICPLRLASYGYNTKDMMYKWSHKKVTVDPDVSIAQYELVNISTSSQKVTVRRNEEISTLQVKFVLTRLTGFFLLQVYVPCILIVCCSWVAFWITKKDVPGRVCLGVTTVLSMTTLGFGGRSAWPEVSYATALDYFVILCFAFVFAAVLEFAMINFIERAANKRRKKIDDLKTAISERENTLSGTTMKVTTTMLDSTAGVEDSLRQILKVPLTVVPSGIPEDPSTASGLKNILGVPLVVVPESVTEVEETNIPEEMQQTEGDTSRDRNEPYIVEVPSVGELEVGIVPSVEMTTNGMEVGVVPSVQEETVTSSDEIRRRLPSNTSQTKSIKETKPEKEASATEDTVVRVEMNEDDAVPPTVTIFQLLCRKKYLIRNITPLNPIPTEEEILDRFSIIDLWARRLFPSTFFMLFFIYWGLFNYYITDEFPEEGGGREPSDGLIVT